MLGNILLFVIICILFSSLFLLLKLLQAITEFEQTFTLTMSELREEAIREKEKTSYEDIVYQPMPTIEERPNPYLDPQTGLYNYQYYKKHQLKEDEN